MDCKLLREKAKRATGSQTDSVRGGVRSDGSVWKEDKTLKKFKHTHKHKYSLLCVWAVDSVLHSRGCTSWDVRGLLPWRQRWGNSV